MMPPGSLSNRRNQIVLPIIITIRARSGALPRAMTSALIPVCWDWWSRRRLLQHLLEKDFKYEIVEYLFPFLTRRGSGGLINVI